LNRQGTSLSQLCNELALSGSRDYDRTMGRARAEIRAFYAEHGTRPTKHVNVEWRRWADWLRKRDTSLCQLCDEMGLPGGRDYNRTMERAKAEIRAFYAEHNKRPTTIDKEWHLWDCWLRTQQSTTLRLLCDEMDLPGGLDLDRTMDRARAEIRAFYAEHNKRPRQSMDNDWKRWDRWLRARGINLRLLCNEMGLPPERVGEGGLKSCRWPVVEASTGGHDP